MALSQEGLVQFAKLYTQEFGEELGHEETERRARYLINLYIAVFGSLSVRINQLTNEVHE